jgi:hypothetical protein
LEMADVNNHIKPERGTDVDNHETPIRKAVLKIYTVRVRLISYQSVWKICMGIGMGMGTQTRGSRLHLLSEIPQALV